MRLICNKCYIKWSSTAETAVLFHVFFINRASFTYFSTHITSFFTRLSFSPAEIHLFWKLLFNVLWQVHGKNTRFGLQHIYIYICTNKITHKAKTDTYMFTRSNWWLIQMKLQATNQIFAFPQGQSVEKHSDTIVSACVWVCVYVELLFPLFYKLVFAPAHTPNHQRANWNNRAERELEGLAGVSLFCVSLCLTHFVSFK